MFCMYHPWCSKCKRIVVFSGGRPSLITNNNTWMEPQRRMVTMAWMNSVIHHNGVYVHSDPQCHYYSWEGRKQQGDCGSMNVAQYLFSFCVELQLNSRSFTIDLLVFLFLPPIFLLYFPNIIMLRLTSSVLHKLPAFDMY